jgi:Protein of unknown function (DUF4446)
MDPLSIVALAVAAVSLTVSAVAVRAARRSTGSGQQSRKYVAHPPARSDVAKLREDVASLRTDLADALRHLAVVRYDAFGDMSGYLSWSMALLDDNGNGVVLTSINNRGSARSYAKNVRDYESDVKLSPEEAEAIEYLRKESGR